MSIEDPRISAISSENVSHDFRQDIHEDASIEASVQQGVEVAQADNSQQPEKTDRVPAAPQIVAANAHPAEIVPDQNNIAHLPADVSIDDIRVEGNNLVLVQADGTEIVIVNGALHVPTFLLGEVELPQQAVIAALEQSNINVAAGPDGSYSASASAPSSGADFQDTIQQDPNDPTQLAKLLADTQQPDPGFGDGQELFDDLPTISDTTTLSLTEIEGQEGGFETQSVNGTFGFNGGADVGQITAVQFVDSLNVDEGTQNGSHLDLTSDGKPVVITVDGLTITGSVDGQSVFVLTVTNAATGAFTFIQFGPLDHPDKGQAGLDDILRLQFSYTVTDKDGDQATGIASININDDGPNTGSGVDSSSIDESDLLSGEGGNASVHDVSLGIHWGADDGANRNLTFASVQDQLSGLKSGGQTVQFEISADGHTLTGFTGEGEGRTEVFVVTLDPTAPNGAYSFTLLQPLDHPHESETGDTQLDLGFNFVATDADGDTANGSFAVDVNDDVPTADSSDMVTVTEAAANGVFAKQTANGTLVFHQGADGAEVTNITYRFGSSITEMPEAEGDKIESHALTSNGQPITVSTSADGLTVTGKVGDVTIFALQVTDAKTGAYTFTQTGPIDHPDKGETGASDSLRMVFDFTVTDRDGDTATNAVQVDIRDDGPTISGDAHAVNLLANGNFAGGTWAHPESWGAWATESTGWKIDGTVAGQSSVQLERVTDGYLGMHAANGSPMVDLGASPGNIAISQNIAGLAAGEVYKLSFQAGSPDPASSGLEVYWNGELVYTYSPTSTMKSINLDLTAIGGANTLTFKEIGNSSDNTGTYLANVSLTHGDAVPVLTATTGEDSGVVSFHLTPGQDYSFGADGAGAVTFNTDDATIATPTGTIITLPAGAYHYDSATGIFTINPGWAFNGLSQGEVATLSVPFTVTDADGDTKTGAYQITITGSNDAVTTSEAFPDKGTITEYQENDSRAGSGDDRTIFDAPVGHAGYNGGAFYIYDDQGDKHIVTVQAGGEGYLGYITAAVSEETANDGVGLVSWKYHVTDAALNPLGAGETRTEVFHIKVDDGHGSSTVRDVTVTLVGTNDKPIFEFVTDTGSVVEDTSPTATGTIAFSDVDLIDTHIVSVTPPAGALLGTFSLGSVSEGANAANGSVGWTYTLNASAQPLAAGEVRTETYKITLDDNHGGVITKDITITITGTNDAAIIGGATSGSVTEDVTTGATPIYSENFDNRPLGSAGDWGNNGWIQDRGFSQHLSENNFGNFDGQQSISKVINLGSAPAVVQLDFDFIKIDSWDQGEKLTVYLNNGVAFTFTPENFGFDGKDGATGTFSAGGITGTYVITSSGHDSQFGGSVLFGDRIYHISITASGASDSFKLGFGNNLDEHYSNEDFGIDNIVVRDAAQGQLFTQGDLTVTDVDHDQSSFVAQSGTTGGHGYGVFTLTAAGHWTYTANNANPDIQALAAGTSVTDSFVVRSIDGTEETVTVTINGTNDAAKITGSATGSLTEDGVVTAVSGKLIVTDIDTGEAHFQTPGSVAGTYGTFTFNTTTGEWGYSLNSAAANVQALTNGQKVYDTLTVTSADGTAQQEIKVTITGSNDTATIDGTKTGSIVEDTSTGITGTLSVSDVDSGEARFETPKNSSLEGKYGDFTFNAATGTWTYKLDNQSNAVQSLKAGEVATDTLTVKSFDGTATETITVTVTGANDVAKITGQATGSITEDFSTKLQGDLDVSDRDSGEEAFQVPAQSALAGKYGTFTFNATTGSWTYKLDNSSSAVQSLAAGQKVTDTLTVTSLDGTDSETITITVTGTNDKPVATADTFTVTEDDVASRNSAAAPFVAGNVLANDTDIDSTSLSVTGISNVTVNTASGTGLTLSVASEGNGVYKITTNFGEAHLSVGANGDVKLWSDSGEDPFKALGVNETATIKFDYTVSDGSGGTDKATAIITVQGSNDNPVAVDDTTLGGVSATYSDNFNNTNTDGWTFVKLSGNPNWSMNGGSLVERTNSSSNDGNGIALAPANSLPATSKVYTIEVDGDPNTGNGNPQSNQALGVVFGYQDATHYYRAYWKDFGDNYASQDTHRDLVLERVDGDQVTVLDIVDKANLGPNTIHFKVEVDGNGIDVTVTGNGHPVVLHSSDVPALGGYGVYTDDNDDGIAYDNFTASTGGGQIATNEDTALTISTANLLANDSDVDGDTLSIVGVSAASAHGGTVTLNNNGTITYNPAANYNGKDTFTYTVSDGHGGTAIATVTVNVTPVNDAPVNSVPGAVMVDEDTSAGLTGLSISDVDAGSSTITTTLSVLHGALTLASLGGAQVLGNGSSQVTLTGTVAQINAALADNNVSYKGVSNYSGSDTLTVKTDDGGHTGGGALTDTDTVSISVTPVNDPAVLSSAVVDLTEGNTQSALNASGKLSISDIDSPATFVPQSNVAGSNGYGTFSIDANGNWSYQANSAHDEFKAGQTYTDSLTVSSADGTTSTVTVNTTGTNDAPKTNAASGSGDEDAASISVALSGSDIDGSVASYTITDLAANGKLYSDAGLSHAIAVGETVTGSTVYFVPDANYNGTTSFHYAAVDNDGLADGSPATATITVASVNDAPETTAASGSGDEDAASISVALSGSDIDGSVASYTITDLPANGKLYSDAGLSHAILVGETVSGSTVYFVPDVNYNGTTSFHYAAVDNDGLADASPATATVTVASVNDAPVAVNDSYTTNEDTTLHISPGGLLANDSDVEQNTLSSIPVTGPAHGTLTLSANGSFDYTPNANYNGTDSFTYKVNDGTADSAVATVNITVNPVNDAPNVPSDGSGLADAVAEGAATGTLVGITATATDVDGDTVTYSLDDNAGGRFTINSTTGVVTVANGSLLNYETATSHVIVIKASDASGASSTQSFTIGVSDVAPSAPADGNGGTNTVAEGAATGTLVGITATATDVNGGTVTYSLDDNAGGRFAINSSTGVVTVANGSLLNYETATSHMIVIKASDASGASSTQSFTIGVSDVAPSAPADGNGGTNTVAEGAATGTLVGITATATDVNGGTVTYSLDDNAGGRFAINSSTGVVTVANGSLLNYETATSHMIVIKASDASGASSTQSFTIGVTDVVEVAAQATQHDYGQGNNSSRSNAYNISDLNYVKSSDSEVTDALNSPSVTISARTTSNQTDFYKLVISEPGTFVRLDIDHGSFDTVIYLRDSNGMVIAGNDDSASDAGSSNSTDSALARTLNAGTYYVEVGKFNIFGDDMGDFTNSSGTYELQVSVVKPNGDPIILDLDHNGVALTSLDNSVQFDINADGHKDQIAWTAGTDGILALDVDGNGKIDNGSEIFSPHFAGGSYVDGLAALSTLDSNHDGKIDAADEAFSKLTVWQDLNHNGITDSGELSSLADHSISSISLDANASNSEINGQSILADGSYTLTDGSTGHFVEVAFDTTLGGSENGGNAYSLIGSDGDDTLSGSGGMFTISGGAGVDTFVLDADALNDVKLADVITDFKASEGDTLDVSKLLDSLLGHEASEAEALASVKTTVSGTDTVVSVSANGGWHDVAVLQNTTEAVKILFDDKHDTTTAPHVG
ncbi:T1SS-143 domain-containing protein/type I secretion C-terminal target domain (VC_A0849 subclass) [Rhizobium tibeticum]|uniref:T1SS-143 domain-containing protein/type I secretion C-terminal target domain (VC_A0849 subclass) n=1 Tax=Rhizobium tibeticum TaxID=501024 RepID=A0A1H8UBE9_9HYPH|nr:VCBS domain-containing protein [Rhizobium tibeticum]SEI16964.1 VCBS repeat [Rhizobium tibeticum]SEP00560.1 T1SS-143 domain-containing protein/type I secretion C-terminal target domain (VC_A0849 subclass) [Rhizobium tibeticum]